MVSSFLLLDPFCSLEAEVGRIIPQDSIGGFNLLLLAPASRPDGSLHFDSLLVTNHGAGGTVSSRPLSYEEKFCGCISNAVDGTTPPWPKVDHAPREFSSVLRRLSPSMSEAELTDNLFELLRCVSHHSRIRDSPDLLRFLRIVGDLRNLSPLASTFEIQYTLHQFRLLRRNHLPPAVICTPPVYQQFCW